MRLCVVGRGRTPTAAFGMDSACSRVGVRAGKPGRDEWAAQRRAFLARGRCVVCLRPCYRLSFGMDGRCYDAWRRAGQPDLGEWVPARRKWLGYRNSALWLDFEIG
jgi:hypothetical protein